MSEPKDDLLSRLVALEKAATPGSKWTAQVWSGVEGGWAAVGPHHEPEDIHGDEWQDGDDEPGGRLHERAKADAEFLSALVSSFPALRRRLEAAERLAEAVEFYADQLSWDIGAHLLVPEKLKPLALKDRGEKARAALAAYRAAKETA